MRKLLFSACAVVAAGLAIAQVAHVVRNVDTRPEFGERTVAKSTPRHASRAQVNLSENVNAAFTILGADAQQAVWTENFDTGAEGWTLTPDANNYVTVKLKTTTGSQAYSTIDETDVQSLFMEGPYKVYQRSIAWATSPAIDVPAGGVFHAQIGFSKTFNEYAVLTLTASTDDFATSTELWNSTQEAEPNTWRWHAIDVDMAQFAGQQVKLRFIYGPGTNDTFNTGGYMADYAIDGLSITAPASVDGVDVKTGEIVSFVDMSTGDIASRSWSFPGATPSTSTEANPSVTYRVDGNYDVTLTVTGTDGTTSTVTRTAFVHVTGEAPVARIMPPATFRDCDTYLPMVAPLAPVQFTDASTGCPTQWNWTFANATPGTSTLENPWVSYDYQHQQNVKLTVANQHGSSSDELDVSVEYGNYICNQLSTDYPVTYDLEGSGTFPGSNTMKIDAYAEHFSKPSAPMMVYGALVFFETAQAENIVDQIANVGVSLYSVDNGLPGKRIESTWWSVYELATSTETTMRGTYFEFSTPQVVNDEFFVVVDGIPTYNDSCNVSFAMSNLRNENTAFMRLRGNWRPVSGFFNAKGSSFYIWPAMTHSVLTLLPVGTDEIHVPATAGTIDQQIFSLYGYDNPEAKDSDWARIVSTPNELTLDTLAIQYDALPDGIDRREMTFTITDRINATTITFKVIQERETSGLRGDVNGDGIVDITDVNMVINMVLGKVEETSAADFDGNGIIDITDVNTIINIVLGKE